MAFPNKTSLPTAVAKRSQQDLSSVHVTTSNFMEFNVAKFLRLAPTQSVDIDHKMFTRLEPMPYPTFGLANIHKKAFFVPFRTVFPAFNDFINDTMHVHSDGTAAIVSYTPRIKNSVILATLTNTNYGFTNLVTVISDNSDIQIVDLEGSVNITRRYNFTPKGRRIFKLLTSLGFKLDYSKINNDSWHCMLPLLCVAKIYLDWYYPNQYIQNDTAVNVEKWLKFDTAMLFENAFTQTDLLDFFNLLDNVCYDNDYFTSAWDNPNLPNNNSFSRFNIVDITSGETYKQQVSVGNSVAIGNGNAPKLTGGDTLQNMPAVHSISQYALNALKSLTDYMKRHQIAGARSLDRYISRWGVTLSSDKLDRSLYLGGSNQDIQFGDVTSTADTDGAQLGAYAGKGVSYGDGNISFTADEHGMLIIITSIVPVTSYYQGADKSTLAFTKLDFFTPEFDNLGVQPLTLREVYMPLDGNKLYNGTPTQFNPSDKIFGFVPRYAEYKTPYNVLSGDYILNSKNAGKDSWTLFRDLDPLFANVGADSVKHSVNFVNASDSSQYSRIFYTRDNATDKFNVIHQFTIKSNFPGASLYDDYDFDSEGKAKNVTIDTGSVKAN